MVNLIFIGGPLFLLPLTKRRLSEFAQKDLVNRPRCFLKKHTIQLEKLFAQKFE